QWRRARKRRHVQPEPRGPGVVQRLARLLGRRRLRGTDRGRERFELAADDRRLLEQRLLLQLVAPAPAIEEAVARPPEALPQLLALGARERAGLLPVGLEALHGRGGRLPVGRIGEGFGLLAQLDLRLRSRATLGVEAREALLATGEEAVARRAELLP